MRRLVSVATGILLVSLGTATGVDAVAAWTPDVSHPATLQTAPLWVTIDEDSPAITYSGAGWWHYLDRGYGDYGDDVKGTFSNGASFSVSFTGTGLTMFSEEFSDQGLVDMYVDGVHVTTIDTSNPVRLAQQPLFSTGTLSDGDHVVTGVKQSGSFMVVDRFDIKGVASAPTSLVAGTSITLRSTNYPDRFLRQRGDATLGIDQVPTGSSLADRTSATFTVRAGLAGSDYSFESRAAPGSYLVLVGGQPRISADDGSPGFASLATFAVGPGLSGTGISLSPVTQPGYYLRHHAFALYSGPYEDHPTYRSDASYAVHTPLAP